MNYKVICLFLLLWAISAQADEPYGFKEYRIGMTFTEADENFALDCSATASAFSDVSCSAYGNETIAGVTVKELRVGFHDGRLTSIRVSFSSIFFNEVEAALREKYGKPKSAKTSIVHNAFGATFSKKSLTWRNRVSSISAADRVGRVDEGAVMYFSSDLMRNIEERKKTRKRSGSKDL